MSVKPTVPFRAMLVGGIAAFAKIGGAMSEDWCRCGCMTAAATAAVSGSKQEPKNSREQSSK